MSKNMHPDDKAALIFVGIITAGIVALLVTIGFLQYMTQYTKLCLEARGTWKDNTCYLKEE